MMLEFLNFLKSRFKRLFYIQLIILLFSVLYLFVYLKPWYRSSTTVLITEDTNGSLISALANSLPIGLPGFGNSGASKFIAILSTNRVADSVINKYQLMDVYKSNYYDNTLTEFRNNLGLLDNDDNTVIITFQYENDASKAAEITQYLYDLLYQITLESEQTSASNYSNHIEKYLIGKRQFLTDSEDSLKQLQKDNLFFEPTSQAQLIYSKILELEKEKLTAEFVLFNLKQSKGSNSIEYSTLNQKINYLTNEIDRLSTDPNSISIKTLSNLNLSYYRLLRNIEVTSKVVEFLQLQYEQAVLDEHKKSINIQQLSKPRISDTKVKPKRLGLLIVINTFGFIAILFGFKAEHFYRKNEETIQSFFSL